MDKLSVHMVNGTKLVVLQGTHIVVPFPASKSVICELHNAHSGLTKASLLHNKYTTGPACAPTSSHSLTHVFRVSRHGRLWLDRSCSRRTLHHRLSNLCAAPACTCLLQLDKIGSLWSTATVATLGQQRSPIQLPDTCFPIWRLGLHILAGPISSAKTMARNFVPSSLSSARPTGSHMSYHPRTIRKATAWPRQL